MKAAQLKRYGGWDAVAMADISKPAVSEGKVLIEIHAAGVKRGDLLFGQAYVFGSGSGSFAETYDSANT